VSTDVPTVAAPALSPQGLTELLRWPTVIKYSYPLAYCVSFCYSVNAGPEIITFWEFFSVTLSYRQELELIYNNKVNPSGIC
jgi:hypothetical protein